MAIKIWGLSKLHEAVPELLVELRHQTTDGQLPGLTVLGAAVKLAWLDVHYWGEVLRGQVVVAGVQEEEVHPDRSVLVTSIGKC